jgi:hypothetical protein
MKIRLIVIFTFINCLAHGQAQKWTLGVEGGISLCSIYNDARTDPYIGFSSGFTIEYVVNSHLSFGSGLLYQRKGNYYHKEPSSEEGEVFPLNGDQLPEYPDVESYTDRLDYLIVPALCRFYPGRKHVFYLESGLWSGYLIDAKYIIKSANENGNTRNQTYSEILEYRSLDFGASFGTGLSITFGKLINMDIGVRYDPGLMNIDANHPGILPGNIPLLNNSIGLVAGLKYRIGQNKK